MSARLLLVNCYREGAAEKIKSYRTWLEKGAARLGLELAVREAAGDGPLPEPGEYDAAVLSGSHEMIGESGLDASLAGFIRETPRPLLGICYGHQALASAFGGRVVKAVKVHKGDEKIRLAESGRLFSGFPETFTVNESHEEVVRRDPTLEATFRVTAESGDPGMIEAIEHRGRPLHGVQFHPERSGEPGIRLLVNFLKEIAPAGPSGSSVR